MVAFSPHRGENKVRRKLCSNKGQNFTAIRFLFVTEFSSLQRTLLPEASRFRPTGRKLHLISYFLFIIYYLLTSYISFFLLLYFQLYLPEANL